MNASIRQPRNIGRCLSLHAAARQQDVRLIFNKRNIRQLTVFVSPAVPLGVIARLTHGTPARDPLHCQVGLASGRSLGRDWRRRPGRPRACWADQLRKNTEFVPANIWRQAILVSMGPWWSDATARAGDATTTMLGVPSFRLSSWCSGWASDS